MNEALLDPQAWERFSTPTNRYQEHVHFVLDDLDDQAQGPVALTGCAVEALSSTESITCESFRAFVRRRGVVFSQEHDVFVSPSYHRGITPAFQICTNFVSFVDGRASHLTAWSSRVGEKPVAFFNFLLVLLARIEQLDMLHIICQNGGRPVVPFSGPALEDFLTNANDNLGRLEFHNFAFEERQWRMHQPVLTLISSSAGAKSAILLLKLFYSISSLIEVRLVLSNAKLKLLSW